VRIVIRNKILLLNKIYISLPFPMTEFYSWTNQVLQLPRRETPFAILHIVISKTLIHVSMLIEGASFTVQKILISVLSIPENK
jgi:hypothetical protein